MAWMDIHFYSEILGIESEMYVLIPEVRCLNKRAENVQEGTVCLPVLYHYPQYYRYINGFLIDFPNKLIENPDILDFLPVDGLRF